MITRAYPALYLGGTPSQETGTSLPRGLLLENGLYLSPNLYESSNNKCGDIFTYIMNCKFEECFFTISRIPNNAEVVNSCRIKKFLI